jgi:hypothetical protein
VRVNERDLSQSTIETLKLHRTQECAKEAQNNSSSRYTHRNYVVYEKIFGQIFRRRPTRSPRPMHAKSRVHVPRSPVLSLFSALAYSTPHRPPPIIYSLTPGESESIDTRFNCRLLAPVWRIVRDITTSNKRRVWVQSHEFAISTRMHTWKSYKPG